MLLWDEQGQIQCEKHTPFRGSDSWVRGRWRAITWNGRVDFQAEIGRAPQCETCRAVEERHAEGRHELKRPDECRLCAVVSP